MGRHYCFKTIIGICLAFLTLTSATAVALDGLWEWDYTYGGIAGQTFDPGTEGHTKQLELHYGGTARAYRDGVLFETGTWSADAGIFIENADIFAIAGGMAEKTVIGDVEYLVLRAPCCDMYDHHLHRPYTIIETAGTTFAAVRALYR